MFAFFRTFAVGMTERKIIHVDMDQFFAAVEQRDHPELRGRPIAVGYDGERGVVSTASYEARRFGVHSAQSVKVAKRLCPQLTIVEGDYRKYKAVSKEIHSVFHEYTDLVEPLSIDEAFLDVTVNKRGMELAVDIAREIKAEIFRRTQLTASAGVSYCKFLAKVASDWRKPDGLCTIHPDRALDFIAQLPIERFWGVGEKTAAKMHWMGIFNGSQLRQVSLEHLTQVFGKAGRVFYDFARGVDERPVVTDYERKSVGTERTFEQDIWKRAAVVAELYHTVMELLSRIEKSDFSGKTLTLKVKFYDFTQITRSMTANRDLRRKDDILPLAKQLLSEVDYGHDRPIRLMGLSVSNPTTADDTNRWEELWLEFDGLTD